jgi:hypothetical protein
MGHAVHTPVESTYLPAAHETQTPLADEVPAGHGTHAVEVALGVCPAGQVIQPFPSPIEYFPAGHVVQPVEYRFPKPSRVPAVPELEPVPAGHEVHIAEPLTPPVLTEYVPAVQGVHAVAAPP